MIRTRFAPSPTGELHIGGARTALFNFLFARGAGAEGRFVLRIDDTDAERSRVEYERRLMEELLWLGLDWDEGPDRGLSISYRQSERGLFYDGALSNLRARAAVYPCFCSEERLAALRKEQLARGEPPRYDGLCRSLPRDEVERRMAGGERPCWRFALPQKTIAFHDMVRGDLSFAPDMGDFVVARSDGQATYLFASVVDDHLMEITHVIRGDEHVPNTARQQALFDALSWRSPVYAHIPMILSGDHQKLSKRTGSTPIRRYREEGYLPEALCAYLSTLSWVPSGPLSLFSLKEMAAAFSPARIATSSPVHDEAHLVHHQREAMRRLGSGAILERLTALDPRFGKFEPAGIRLLIGDLLEEYWTLPLLQDALSPLFAGPSAWAGELRKSSEPWLSDAGEILRSVEPWNEETLDKRLRGFMKERGLRGRDFFHPLRLFLTGRESGPPLTLLMRVLGRDETRTRLEGPKGRE
ncbi:MAG: glutamate--tRNA ligase [Synergistaceae bacterium]|jgi:glutamyl-tRNA synthetase|nr:glutamate--tRNA ligase [Synergistaceae bacterium]